MKRVMFTKMVWKIGGVENVAQTVLEMMKDSMGIEPSLVVSDAQNDFRLAFLMENFRMNTCDLIPLEHSTVLRVVAKMFPYSFRVKKCVRKYSPDAIISVDSRLAVPFRSISMRKPIILWLHNSIEQQFHKRDLCFLFKLSIAVCDAIVALNEGMRQEIRNLFLGVLPKTVAIHNSVNVLLIEAVYSPYPARFTSVCEFFYEEKSLDRFLRAFHVLQWDRLGWQLVLTRDGPRGAMVETLTREDGLQQSVELEGWQENLWRYLSSIGGEGFGSFIKLESSPLTIVEAMMSGLPVAWLDWPVDPSEIVKEERNGFIVPFVQSEEENVKNLATALSRMADNVSSWDPDAVEVHVEEFRSLWLKAEWESHSFIL